MPVLGICLGAQIVAHALGGEVGPVDAGYQFGLADIHLTPAGRDDPLFAGLGWSHVQLHHHGEAITTLPDGAKGLAKSDDTAVQAFAKGLRTYGFQFHPECSHDQIVSWFGLKPSSWSRQASPPMPLNDNHSKPTGVTPTTNATRFDCLSVALLLMPVDRRFAGTSGELRH